RYSYPDTIKKLRGFIEKKEKKENIDSNVEKIQENKIKRETKDLLTDILTSQQKSNESIPIEKEIEINITQPDRELKQEDKGKKGEKENLLAGILAAQKKSKEIELIEEKSDEGKKPSKIGSIRESICLNCQFMFGACPRGLDSFEMEKIYVCDYFQSQKIDTKKLKEVENNYTYDKENLDILELFSRDLDLQEEKVSYGVTGGTVGTDNYDIEPGMTPCLTCKYMFGGCPQDIDSEKMELMTDCASYEPLEMPEPKPIEEPKKEKKKEKKDEILFKNVSRMDYDITPSQTVKEDSLSIKKKDLLADILVAQEKSKGELRVVCSACESEMTKKKTRKKEYYACSNFPECKVQGELWYMQKSIKSKTGIAINKLKSDLIIMYKFDKVKNVISISSIFSEQKLFL
ncbi:MAG: hypothetical protein GY870_18150, partial [archaeon]|nr:hypothetical protein [archaeon]